MTPDYRARQSHQSESLETGAPSDAGLLKPDVAQTSTLEER